MPHSNQTKKGASGGGTIRKKTVKSNEKTYTYWEARFTTGFDPGTGKQKQRSITGKTQKEVAQKLRQATADIDSHIYVEPSKIRMSEWLDIWQKSYLGGVKPRTVEIYDTLIRIHIKPALGATCISTLDTQTIQNFYNDCSEQKKLSAKTVKNIHCVIHRCLQQAVANGYLRYNPSNACVLPRSEKRELKPLDDYEIAALLREIKGSRMETLVTVALFTGMREGELMGLMWNCVDFVCGTITVNKQLQLGRAKGGGEYRIISAKNGKSRVIVPADFVMQLLRRHREEQAEEKRRAGSAWEESGFVFTDELGHHLQVWNVYREFKRAAAAIGRPDARVHDCRHSYAVAAIRSGDDIKTVQGNLGHATAAFTLDVYGHVTEQMKRASAARMDAFIQKINGL